MTDYSQFEASMKSGVQADAKRIRKMDEIIVPIIKGTRRFLLVGLVLFAAAAGRTALLFVNTGFRTSLGSFIAPAALLLAALFCFFRYAARRKLVEGDLREYYEEGLLVGGMIVGTQPLTLMALASLVANDGAPDRYGCYKLVVKNLDGAKGELYEKIPCSCFFRYESGNYHDAFQPHPLYWATTDQDAIDRALYLVERENEEDQDDIWGVIRRVADQFPDLKDGQLVILDENYEPIGIRYYWQTGLDPVVKEEDGQTQPEPEGGSAQDEADSDSEREYRKMSQEASQQMRDDKPGRDVYERFAALACRFQVYDYISGHCKSGSISNCSHPGFFTCIGDPVTFPQELKERRVTLQTGEYPLFMGSHLATTRGFYRKKEFISWRDAQIAVKVGFLDTIKIYINGKVCTEFEPNVKGYENWERITEEEKPKIARLEGKRVEEFLLYIKEYGL